MICKKHPYYRGIRRPRVCCEPCYQIYDVEAAKRLPRPRKRWVAVARLVGTLSNKEIARLTGLTPSTVRQYLHEAFREFGFKKRAQLALHYERNREVWDAATR